MSDAKQEVLKVYPDAYAKKIVHDLWWVMSLAGGEKELGRGRTRNGAWADALSRIQASAPNPSGLEDANFDPNWTPGDGQIRIGHAPSSAPGSESAITDHEFQGCTCDHQDIGGAYGHENCHAWDTKKHNTCWEPKERHAVPSRSAVPTPASINGLIAPIGLDIPITTSDSYGGISRAKFPQPSAVPTPADIKRNPVGVLAKLLQEGGAVPVINGQRIEPSAGPTKCKNCYKPIRVATEAERRNFILPNPAYIHENGRWLCCVDQFSARQAELPVPADETLALLTDMLDDLTPEREEALAEDNERMIREAQSAVPEPGELQLKEENRRVFARLDNADGAFAKKYDECERLKLLVREMGEAITSLLSDLPSKRDWLDPVLESRLWEAKSSYRKSQSEEKR